MPFFCLKHKGIVTDRKVQLWCNKFDCWALKQFSTKKRLNQIKGMTDDYQLFRLKKQYYGKQTCDQKSFEMARKAGRGTKVQSRP